MKKRILSIALALSLVPAMVAPAQAAPPSGSIIQDQTFYAAVLKIIGKQDGYVITPSDVAGITEVWVNYKGIKNLDGIEYFTALTRLSCDSNQLTKLDVSKNTALTRLWCNHNYLTALDVCKNITMTYLDCSNNQLTALDVSKNTAMITLSCGVNQLTELDASKNTALTGISCDDNQLTTLDVSKNTELEELYCYDNQLKTLDVSKNTALKYFDCSDNQLKTLDVSKNTVLESLHCGDNQLTTLDISNNTALEYFDCRDNYFPSKAAITGLNEGTLKYFVFGSQKTPVSPIDTAASWAREGITKAVGKGFVPADIQDKYTNIITRQEFCRMAVKWIEYQTGKDIDTILTEQGKSRDPNAFTDTSDPDILAAFALGITNGTGNNNFTPNGQFSREQAATMIRNTCKAAGMDVSAVASAGFKDIGAAASWATGSINFVRNAGIMQGSGDGNYNPKGTYTRQESIITFNNID